jgi:hypothetical protein
VEISIEGHTWSSFTVSSAKNLFICHRSQIIFNQQFKLMLGKPSDIELTFYEVNTVK